MNYFDTSSGYVDGMSEIWTGKAVRDRRSELYFSSKSNWASAPSNTVKNTDKAISGTSVVGYVGTAKVSNRVIGSASVGSSGKFKITIKALETGKVIIIAKDKTGHTSKELKIVVKHT